MAEIWNSDISLGKKEGRVGVPFSGSQRRSQWRTRPLHLPERQRGSASWLGSATVPRPLLMQGVLNCFDKPPLTLLTPLPKLPFLFLVSCFGDHGSPLSAFAGYEAWRDSSLVENCFASVRICFRYPAWTTLSSRKVSCDGSRVPASAIIDRSGPLAQRVDASLRAVGWKHRSQRSSPRRIPSQDGWIIRQWWKSLSALPLYWVDSRVFASLATSCLRRSRSLPFTRVGKEACPAPTRLCGVICVPASDTLRASLCTNTAQRSRRRPGRFARGIPNLSCIALWMCILFCTQFRTNPLTVRRSARAAARILSASSTEQRIKRAVRSGFGIFIWYQALSPISRNWSASYLGSLFWSMGKTECKEPSLKLNITCLC